MPRAAAAAPCRRLGGLWITTGTTCLSAKALGKKLVRRDEYDEHLQQLVDVQLSLESQIRQIEANPRVFKKINNDIEFLVKMEEYLHDIVKEYESKLHWFENRTLDISYLKKLNDFIDKPYEQSTFGQSFSDSFHMLRKKLGKAIRR